MVSYDIPSHLIGLDKPKGSKLVLNKQDFIAIDRRINSKYEATYRPQALYSRADNGFHENHDVFLLHEVATNSPIYAKETGPTDFHLHLPPGGFQLVLVTSGIFTFDYDGQLYHAGPGTVMLQSAIVHRQLFYSWSGLQTEENLKTPQSVVPDALTMGYSAKFLEAFITDPTTFPNPTIVNKELVDESETSRIAWCHPLHDRPVGGDFWFQDPHSLGALYKRLSDSDIKSDDGVYVRNLGIETPSGGLVCGHIIATDPLGYSLLPKSTNLAISSANFTRGEVVIFRIIRGGATFKDQSGKKIELDPGDVVTANAHLIKIEEIAPDSQILRLCLMENIENLQRWTNMQRKEIDSLGDRIITNMEARPHRVCDKPVGYLYR